MKKYQAFLLGCLLGSVCSSRAELDINGKIQVIPIPERSHAAINFSGSSANDVDMVALDDAGNAAYAAPEPHSTPGNVESNTLQNFLRNRSPDNFVPMRWTTVEDEEVVEYYSAAGLTTNGDLYFSLTSYGNAAELCGVRSARVREGLPDYLSLPPPFVRDLRHVTLELEISGANESGYWGGGGGATDNTYSAYGGFFFVRTGERFTIFDGTLKSQYQYQPWIGYRIPSAGSLQVVTANFAPNLANANGWALGNTVAGYWGGWSASPLLWNGQEVIPLLGYGVALNNSNDVLMASSNPDNDMAALLDRGNIHNRRPFRQAGSSPGLIPLPLQSQIRNIRPLQLSSRRTIAGTEIQPVLHIVFAAETLRDPERDAWEQAMFVLRMLSNDTTDLYEIPGARNLNVRSINNTGLLAAIGTPTGQISKQALLLVPADLAVDANRDGTIKFAGNLNNPALAGKPHDRTEEMKPFRFWVNDDNDGLPNAEGEVVGSEVPDHEDETIQTARDLEDFSRLYVHVGGLYQEIASGTIRVGLMWRNTNGTTPKVRVYRSTDTSGSDSYLKSETAAFVQVSGEDAESLGEVAGSTPLILPAGLFKEYSDANPKRCLLFEGSSEGKGQLCITIHKANGSLIGEAPGIWLDLLNVKRMYQRYKTLPENIAAPYTKSTSLFNNASSFATGDIGQGFDKPSDETKKCLIFIHGWNTSSESYLNTAETMFKRLWWQGFKGHFVAFRWDTLTSSPIALAGEYNRSEQRAFIYGDALKKVAENLSRKYTVSIVAHSMGNITAGEALRRGMKIRNYIMMQAAVPASCYDLNAGTSSRLIRKDSLDPTPDLHEPELGYRGFLQNIGGTIIRYYNPDDYALATGFTELAGVPIVESNWEVNQLNFKPDGAYSTQEWKYGYSPSNTLSKRGWLLNNGFHVSPPVFETASPDYRYRLVNDSFEMKAFVARSRTKAVGAIDSVASTLDTSINLKTVYGFGNNQSDHSGQFYRDIQMVFELYREIHSLSAE